MAVSETVANALLDALLGDAHLSSVPDALYLGLSTTDPDTSITELSGDGYERALVPNDSATWPAASGAAKSNGRVILLAAATADWPEVGWWVLYDAATSGNVVASAALSAPVTVTTGRTPRFVVGSLTVSLG